MIQARTRVYLYKDPCDMRKGIIGLSGLVRNVMKQDPLSGHCFCFINKNRNHIKILYWDITGYCLWSKKLTKGTYQKIVNLELSPVELLLELESESRAKRYKLIPG